MGSTLPPVYRGCYRSQGGGEGRGGGVRGRSSRQDLHIHCGQHSPSGGIGAVTGHRGEGRGGG